MFCANRRLLEYRPSPGCRGPVCKVHLGSSITPGDHMDGSKDTHIHTQMHLDTHTHLLMHRRRGRERLRERTCALNRPPEVPEHEEIRLRRERERDFSNKLHKNIFIRDIGGVFQSFRRSEDKFS